MVTHAETMSRGHQKGSMGLRHAREPLRDYQMPETTIASGISITSQVRFPLIALASLNVVIIVSSCFQLSNLIIKTNLASSRLYTSAGPCLYKTHLRTETPVLQGPQSAALSQMNRVLPELGDEARGTSTNE